MNKFWRTVVMLLTGFASGQEVTNIAPPPSDRFPAAWYPADNDVTHTTAPQTGAPYTATMVTRFAGMSFSESSFQARDSAGRMRTEASRPRLSGDANGRVIQGREVSVSDPVSHCSFNWLEPWSGPGEPAATVTCMPPTVHYAKGGLGPDIVKTQVTEERPFPNEVRRTAPLGERTLGDVKAIGMLSTITKTNPGTKEVETFVSEIWYSPELKATMALKIIGNAAGQPSYELTNVNGGEPDPGLFYPPARYKIRSLGPN